MFAIEFKIGEATFHRAAYEQVWDYALDLKNFHEASHTAAIMPILLASEASSTAVINLHADPDQVYRPIAIGPDGLRDVIDCCLARISGQDIDADAWQRKFVSADTDHHRSCPGAVRASLRRGDCSLRRRRCQPSPHGAPHR